MAGIARHGYIITQTAMIHNFFLFLLVTIKHKHNATYRKLIPATRPVQQVRQQEIRASPIYPAPSSRIIHQCPSCGCTFVLYW